MSIAVSVFLKSMIAFKRNFLFCAILLSAPFAGERNLYALDFHPVISNDRCFYEQWYNTGFEYIPRFSHSDTVWIDQPFLVDIFFTDFATGPDSSVNLTFDYTIKNRKGGIFRSDKNIEAYNGKVGSSVALLLSKASLSMLFDTTDSTGPYTASITVTDGIAKKRLL